MSDHIPVDDISISYSEASPYQKDAVSAVLTDNKFIVQTPSKIVVSGLTMEQTGDLIMTMFLNLETEYGKAFTSAMASALLARFDEDAIGKIARRAILHLRGEDERK